MMGAPGTAQKRTSGTRGVRRGYTPQGLTLQQERFVTAFLTCGNQTEAYRQISPSTKNPTQCATNFMRVDVVRAEVARRQALAAARTQVTLDQVRREMALLAFSNLDDFLEIDEDGRTTINWLKIKALPPEERRAKMACLASIEVDELEVGRGEKRRKIGAKTKFKTWDKRAALADLGRDLGGFKTGLEVGNARRPDGSQEPFKVQEVPADPLEAAKLYQAIIEGRG